MTKEGRKGAGPYSRSYATIEKNASFERQFKASTPGGSYAGNDIAERVSAAGTRKESGQGDVVVNRGFAAEVSKGRRPKHKAGSWKRV